jgi:RND family efflux transporter MFP subunit
LKTTIKIGIGAILTGVFIFLIIHSILRNAGGESEPPEAEQQVEVNIAAPEAVCDTLVFDARGTVTSRSGITVSSLSEGRINRLYVSVGSHVRRGQPIALLENAALDSELSHREDALLVSRRTVADLEKRVKTSEEMLTLGIVSEGDLSSLYQELNTTRNDQRDQEIARDQLRLKRANYRILADVDGYITEILPVRSFVSYGEAVAGIISLDDEQVEAYVPYDMTSQLSPGARVTISSDGMSVPGRITSTFPSAESNLIRVIVAPESPVPMNLDVKVTFLLNVVNGVLIPKSAVVMNEGRPVVFLVRGDKAVLKAITVLKDYINRVVIADEFEPGDVLVTENAYLLSDQMNVKVK